MHVPKIQFRFSLLFFEKRNTGFQRSFFNLKGKVNTKVPNFPQLNFGSGLIRPRDARGRHRITRCKSRACPPVKSLRGAKGPHVCGVDM